MPQNGGSGRHCRRTQEHLGKNRRIRRTSKNSRLEQYVRTIRLECGETMKLRNPTGSRQCSRTTVPRFADSWNRECQRSRIQSLTVSTSKFGEQDRITGVGARVSEVERRLLMAVLSVLCYPATGAPPRTAGCLDSGVAIENRFTGRGQWGLRKLSLLSLGILLCRRGSLLPSNLSIGT